MNFRERERKSYPSVCFIHFSSSLFCKSTEIHFHEMKEKVKRRTDLKKIYQNEQTEKSSRAWAPLLSFLASAECMVIHALINRFSNSMVSNKSEFLKYVLSKSKLLKREHLNEVLNVQSHIKFTISNFGLSI